MWATFVPNFLIGLREGLEAALVVSILVAFLVKSGRRDRIRLVWIGVVAAVVLSALVGALLTFVLDSLDTFKQQELFGGAMSIVAVGFVTWMIFWMRRTARRIKGELQERLEAAVAVGAGAVIAMAFLAVAREGIETTVFLWSAARQAGTAAVPLAGFVTGIAVAVALGWLIYRSAIRINLSRFFTWTGAALILVAGGIFAYGIHDLQEAGVLPGLNTLAFDVSAQVPPTSWYGTLLKGVFNFSPATTVLEAIAWVAYVVPVMTLFLWPARTPSRRAPASEPQRSRA